MVSGISNGGRVASVPTSHSIGGGIYARPLETFLKKNLPKFLQVCEKNIILASWAYRF